MKNRKERRGLLAKGRQRLEEALHQYVNNVMLPASYEAFKALSGLESVSYEDWGTMVLAKMKGDQE